MGAKAGFAVEKVQVKHETDADVKNLRGGHVLRGRTDLDQRSGASPDCGHAAAQKELIFGLDMGFI